MTDWGRTTSKQRSHWHGADPLPVVDRTKRPRAPKRNSSPLRAHRERSAQLQYVGGYQSGLVGAQERDHLRNLIRLRDVEEFITLPNGLLDLSCDPSGVRHRWTHDVRRDAEIGKFKRRRHGQVLQRRLGRAVRDL